MMKLVLIRHGETELNKQKKVQGWSDHPLNEAGIKQAYRINNYFKTVNKRFDVVISSPLSRAYETAKIALNHQEIDILIDFHYLERDFGVFENRNVPEVIPVITAKNFTYRGYEDDQMFLKRIQNGLINLYEKYPQKEVVIFCHSHVIKAHLILANPRMYSFQAFLDNASINTFTYDGEVLKVVEYNQTI